MIEKDVIENQTTGKEIVDILISFLVLQGKMGFLIDHNIIQVKTFSVDYERLKECIDRIDFVNFDIQTINIKTLMKNAINDIENTYIDNT